MLCCIFCTQWVLQMIYGEKHSNSHKFFFYLQWYWNIKQSINFLTNSTMIRRSISFGVRVILSRVSRTRCRIVSATYPPLMILTRKFNLSSNFNYQKLWLLPTLALDLFCLIMTCYSSYVKLIFPVLKQIR